MHKYITCYFLVDDSINSRRFYKNSVDDSIVSLVEYNRDWSSEKLLIYTGGSQVTVVKLINIFSFRFALYDWPRARKNIKRKGKNIN